MSATNDALPGGSCSARSAWTGRHCGGTAGEKMSKEQKGAGSFVPSMVWSGTPRPAIRSTPVYDSGIGFGRSGCPSGIVVDLAGAPTPLFRTVMPGVLLRNRRSIQNWCGSLPAVTHAILVPRVRVNYVDR